MTKEPRLNPADQSRDDEGANDSFEAYTRAAAVVGPRDTQRERLDAADHRDQRDGIRHRPQAVVRHQPPRVDDGNYSGESRQGVDEQQKYDPRQAAGVLAPAATDRGVERIANVPVGQADARGDLF